MYPPDRLLEIDPKILDAIEHSKKFLTRNLRRMFILSLTSRQQEYNQKYAKIATVCIQILRKPFSEMLKYQYPAGMAHFAINKCNS